MKYRSFCAYSAPLNLLIVVLILIGFSGCKKAPPNVLLIISDDQGWTDYGFMGHEHIETPAIDQLASESLTFTHGYVSAPLCRPSLATLATGLYPHQHGVTGNDPDFEWEGRKYTEAWMMKRKEVDQVVRDRFRSHPNLAGMLGEAGYVTLQTGKWWEGSWSENGFSKGMTHGDPANGGRHGDEGLKIGREGLQPVYDLMDEADALDRPFFVWYAPFMPHSPHTPPKDLEEKYLDVAPTPAVARYWAMCEWFDQTCGDILGYLEEKGITNQTLVVYVCDNGWIQNPNRPNRYADRSKQTPYEMGIRTPIMYKWPRRVRPEMDHTTAVSSVDIVPTILAACGLEASADMQGVNILDREALRGRKAVFAEDFHHDMADVHEPTRSLQYRVVIEYPWKLILPKPDSTRDVVVELFDLEADPKEEENVAADHPLVVQELEKTLNNWWKPEHLP
jgi:uncharacterized sulfatase